MATATAAKTTRASALSQEAKPEAVKVIAKLTSGIFKGNMVDLTMNSDGSVTHMSDPTITPEEREAWDWLMQKITSDSGWHFESPTQ